MQLVNSTELLSGFTQGLRTDAKELLVVVAKGTFDIPKAGKLATLSTEQIPIVEADEYAGEPGFSAPVIESDYAPRKRFCDVIVNGSACAPNGQPAKSIRVGIKVGSVEKTFNVIGDRAWDTGAGGIGPGFAEPFTRKLISYDVAFGGTDRTSDDEKEHDAFMLNPSGIGYRSRLSLGSLAGTPVPNTEELGDPVKSPLGNYRPMSLGPVARGWESRARFAGTYDDDWMENVFPFLPSNFDERYYQCAPEDQQTKFLTGGEEVILMNLTPDGRRVFTIPKMHVPIKVIWLDGQTVELSPNLDTLYIDSDTERFALTWRASVPLRRNMLEIAQIIVGQMSRGWWRAQDLGKLHFAGLGAAVRGRRDIESGYD